MHRTVVAVHAPHSLPDAAAARPTPAADMQLKSGVALSVFLVVPEFANHPRAITDEALWPVASFAGGARRAYQLWGWRNRPRHLVGDDLEQLARARSVRTRVTPLRYFFSV